MDSVVGDDMTLPLDINGSCRLPDSLGAGEYSTDSMTAPAFSDKMSPIKALTMKDYENQITALKKENFNLKLRIYFMEDRMQQKCDDSTEDIFKTNIELKVELESMKRELAEKQELLISASKALESLAGRESGDHHHLREQAKKDMAALREAFNQRIADLEQSLRTAEEEVEKMAAIAEQEKLKNINMEKQVEARAPLITDTQESSSVPQLMQALQDKDNTIMQLQIIIKNQEAELSQREKADHVPTAEAIHQLSTVIEQKDQELEALREKLNKDKGPTTAQHQSEISRLESCNKLLTEELTQAKTTTASLTKTLEDTQEQNKDLMGQLEQKDNELTSEKKNAVKRDKTIQGLTQLLKEKEKEIAELCHEIEDRDDALAKAREAAHKAQLQKYQGVEEHQTVLLEKQSELAQLHGEHNAKVLEAGKLQRALDRKQQELADVQLAKEQLDEELEDLQQQKKNGDKALNDLKNQLKKMTDEIKDRESALEQQYQELLDESKRKLQTHEVTIQRLTSTLADKEQQLQEYINIVRDFEQNKSPGGTDNVVFKLRQRLKEKEKALEQTLDDKFAAIEEKDNKIHQLQLSLRERERDLDRLNNLLSHSEETINSFDTVIKEKDVELQHLANTLKNLQRAKQDVEDNLNRSLREKDSIISQLQLSLEGKTKDMEEMADSMLNQSQTQARDLAEQMGQRLKVTEAMLAEAVKARERLVADNESAVEGLLATISSKDQLLKESAERYNRMLSERAQEIQELRKQLSEREQQLVTSERQSSTVAQEGHLETAQLRALLAEKDSIINKLLQCGQERDQFLADLRKREGPDHVLECNQTLQIVKEKPNDGEAELSERNSEDNVENILLSKKAVVLLKKELAQKTEGLNKALKRENELKISLTELQSLLTELEGRIEGQAANIDSLTATLTTKDEIITVLHQRLGQRGDSRADHTQDQNFGSGMEATLPGLPQRERTMIGGDSQQEALPNLLALHQEHAALNKALKAEQQLYSSLVRTVKEQDSAQRLHALQLELTAVQLLREQLEEGIKTNEELRDALERELQQVKLGEGHDMVDPKELESVRHQLEDAQRWNTSLQARLGAIQNRGGGVGGAKDSGDTLSFVGDQTSYMSICVGEGHDDSLSLLSPQELRQKVLDLQNCISRLQDQLSQAQESEVSARERKGKDAAASSPWKQQMQDGQQVSVQDKECQTDIRQTLSGRLYDDMSPDSGLGHSRERAHSGSDTFESGETDVKESNVDLQALKSLLSDCGATTVSHLREALLRLRSENAQLHGLLKEQTSTEWKEKESADVSGNSSDVQAESKKAVERSQSKVVDPSKVSVGIMAVAIELTASSTVSSTEWEESPEQKSPSHRKRLKQHTVRHGVTERSRLPLPTRLRVESAKGGQSVGPNPLKTNTLSHQHDGDFYDSDQHVAADCHIPPSPDHSVSSSQRELDGSVAKSVPDHIQAHSDLFNQLELLHQECQEKEALINTLQQRLAGWEEINAELQEKDQMNRKYMEAMQAAESTIAYLTACNLPCQGGFRSKENLSKSPEHVGSDASLYRRCVELQKGLNEKEEHNNHLTELLNMAKKVIASQNTQFEHPEASDLCSRITTALHEGSLSSSQQSPRGGSETSEECIQKLQRHTDTLQKALWEQSRINAELHERLRAADDELLKKRDSREQHVDMDRLKSDQEMTKVLLKCLSAAESAVASLEAHCVGVNASTSGRSSDANADVQMNLDQLRHVLQEKSEFGERSAPRGSRSDEAQGSPQHPLHHNLCSLYHFFSRSSQKICELQDSLKEEQCRKRESKELRTVSDAKGLPPDVQAQLETLHKALREKKKACKSLEERLANALTNTTTPENLSIALQRADKGVQVDLQDLGYETSGKSENDREESSSTDLEVGVKPSCSASSLPSLLKHEQAAFSSTENLDSTSSTPYPSSPALSSAKVSLKSLQVYDEYGASDDPHLLQRQVRELKVQLEHQTRLVQIPSQLRHRSQAGNSAASTSESSAARDQTGVQRVEPGQEGSNRSGLQRSNSKGESTAMKDKNSQLTVEKERTEDRIGEQPQQNLSRSASPARLDSLVQSQARELSQLRQQIKESRRQGALQHRQLEELGKAFRELLEASKVDCYMGGAVKEQLEKSLSILDRLEGRLDKGEPHPDNEDVAALELSRRLAKEVQEKNRMIQSLQIQLRDKGASSHHSSHSDLYHLDRASSSSSSSSSYSSPATQRGSAGLALGQRQPSDWPRAVAPPAGGVQEDEVWRPSGLQGLQRKNGRLLEQLRSSEELNASLRTELDLHRSIMAQIGSNQEVPADGSDGLGPHVDTVGHGEDVGSQTSATEHARIITSDLLGEHLQEIRALRQRLEESIRTNDRLREQLETRLAEVERDPAATNIFIHGSEEQGQLVKEVRLLRGQNQTLKEQLHVGSRDKQKENEKLRETLARRTAKLEQSRRECEALRQEHSRLLEKLQHSGQENGQLQDTLQSCKQELHRLQSEAKLQRQQLSDSQRLLQSLRVELQVQDKIKTGSHKQDGSGEALQEPLDLSELLQEIRHLRLQLERSIQTNTALREKLEEQLLRGHKHSETININYLLSALDEGGGSPGREECDRPCRSSQDEKCPGHCEADAASACSCSASSGESLSGAPSRLVPGHRVWANRNGRHVLGLVEDYSALRRQISEGRKLSRGMTAQLQECLRALRQLGSDHQGEVTEEQHLRNLSSGMNSLQQTLEEASRLLKLVWRVSLPAGGATAGEISTNQQDELLKNEIARLKSRLTQQERMLSGAVKRLRTTNQLKEGMERVIIDQLSQTHGVLKKARGNLETNYCSLIGLKGLSGGPDEGGSNQWPVEGAVDLAHVETPVSGPSAGSDSEASFNCSY